MQLWAKQIGYYRNLLMWLLLPLRILSMPPSSAVHTGIPLRKKGKIRKIYSTKKKNFCCLVVVKVLQFFQDCSLITRILKQVFNKKIVIVQQARIEDIKLLKIFIQI